MTDVLPTPGDDAATNFNGPSRRAVVKTAAHLAWAVPAVSIVSAAPAFAASGPPDFPPAGQVPTSAPINPATGNGLVTIKGIVNTGGEPITGVRSSISLKNTGLIAESVKAPWYFGTSTAPRATKRTFILFTAATVQPGKAVPGLQLKVSTAKGYKAKGSIKYTVAGGGASVSGAIPVNKRS